ncbi:sulfotransferase [Paracoccaceae bacterium]|nr:sulfotransferase [Paracoccaceae bacterium]
MSIPNFFCGGLPKSGTTFIQRLLDLHPEIGCSSEDNLDLIAGNLIELQRSYNDSLLVFGKRIGAKDVPLVEIKVFENAIFNLISDISLNRNNRKKIIGISDNAFLLKNFIHILKFYIDSKFIIIFRNPVDTALSLWDHNHRLYKKENISAHLDIMKIDGKLDIDEYVIEKTKSWNQTVHNIFEKIASAPDRCLVVTYEALSLNKKDTIIKILKFLDCKFNEEIVLDMVYNSSIDRMKVLSSSPEFFSKGRVSFGKNELKPETIKSSIKISKDCLNLLDIKFDY